MSHEYSHQVRIVSHSVIRATGGNRSSSYGARKRPRRVNPRDNVGDGGVIRLSPARSKTLVGRILPISPPIADALDRRRARRDPTSPLVFHRDSDHRRCGHDSDALSRRAAPAGRYCQVEAAAGSVGR